MLVAEKKFCKFCGREHDKPRSEYCEKDCIRLDNFYKQHPELDKNAAIQRQLNKRRPRKCPKCGEIFSGPSHKEYCSAKCGKAAYENMQRYGHIHGDVEFDENDEEVFKTCETCQFGENAGDQTIGINGFICLKNLALSCKPGLLSTPKNYKEKNVD